MTDLDQQLRDASDRLDETIPSAAPRRIAELDRRAVRRNLTADVAKAAAVLAIVITPLAGWQLRSGTSSKVSSSTPNPAEAVVTATSVVASLPTTPTSEQPEPDDSTMAPSTAQGGLDLSSQESHDTVKAMITEVLESHGVETAGSNYSGKSVDPFYAFMNIGESMEIEISAWIDSMPEDPAHAGEAISSSCTGVETPHGWLFVEDSASARQAAVMGPVGSVIAKVGAGEVPIDTLRSIAEDLADRIGTATGQPFVASPGVGEPTDLTPCEAPTADELSDPFEAVDRIFADVLALNGLSTTSASFDTYLDNLIFDASTDDDVSINVFAYPVDPNEPTEDSWVPGEVKLEGTTDAGDRSASTKAGTVALTVSASRLDGPSLPDDTLSAIALELARQLDGVLK